MADELEATKKTLAQYTDIAKQLGAENEALKNQLKMQTEFLTRQLDAITLHRDRLQVALRGIMTRYKVIRECFAKCEAEALEEGLAVEQAQPARQIKASAVTALGLPAPSIHS